MKIVYIDKCIECPHYMQPSHCFKMNQTIENILNIPEWCPLEDSKQEE